MRRLPHLFILGLIAALPAFGAVPQDLDTPTVATVLETPDGCAVTVKYRAVTWGTPAYNLSEPPGGETGSAGGANGFSARMGTIAANVQLRIGPAKLDPGTYEIGFAQARPGAWAVVLSQGGQILTQLPIVMREEKETVSHLMMTLRPGVTGKDFIFTCVYGTLSTSLRWTLFGVPAQGTGTTAGEDISGGPDLYGGAAWNTAGAGAGAAPPAPSAEQEEYLGYPVAPGAQGAAVNPVNPVTPDAARAAAGMPERPAVRTKAGSGIFRRLLEKQNQEKPKDHDTGPQTKIQPQPNREASLQ